MTMDKMTSVQKGIEEMDIVTNEEQQEDKKQEEKVEEPKTDTVKEEPSPRAQNTPVMSGRKMRKIVKPPPEAPRQRKRRLPRKRLPRKTLSRNMHFWLYDLWCYKKLKTKQ
ncbi:uncharacterized protein LOC105663762 [Megachile rotundata]|uniref:uncharacterized protein LOC105663762 n=1 Tax=Megachile rotundata TaxID=143995 RepID=UPI003FD1E85D